MTHHASPQTAQSKIADPASSDVKQKSLSPPRVHHLNATFARDAMSKSFRVLSQNP
ncbi:hypothetical protein IMCC12053_2690 [Celeribacter marinus]|uniref:Uncharacterized protein n=1 Tax=Celeribacter marinus TaxID=1397108 RepID=A0A0N7HJ00_9RHOB|nr:hypothetical protein IMCC12053_2690 [Celeribacter marinus]